MPTPFTHLELAQRFITDARLKPAYRTLLEKEKPAFLLGSIVADARIGNGMPRSYTHFYSYSEGIDEHPWRVMLKSYPTLWMPKDDAHRAFIAGYVAHLSVDEYWTIHMVADYFFERNWLDHMRRYLMLHVLLVYMDQRDLKFLDKDLSSSLKQAKPDQWLEFIPDKDLCSWQELIYDQIKPGGRSETLQIFGERIGLGADGLYDLMNTEEKMKENLWRYVPKSALTQIEQEMYDFALGQMITYLEEVDAKLHT